MIGASFSKSSALSCARYIARAYRQDLPRVAHIKRTDTQVYFVAYPDHTLLVFPGTDSAHDLLTDLRIKKYAWRVGRVHAGFLRAAESVIDPIHREPEPGTPIVVTGHSLGGALAMLAAYALLEMNHPVRAVYTFGSPRVGNGPFARGYNDVLGIRTWRVVNQGDPVPRVPWLLGTYRHAGVEVYVGQDRTLTMERNPIRLAVDWVTTAGEPQPSELVSLQAHGIEEYIKRLSTP